MYAIPYEEILLENAHKGALFRSIGLYGAGPAASAAPAGAQIESKNIRVEFNSLLHSRVVARFDGKEIPLGDFAPSVSLTAGGATVRDFNETARKSEAIRDDRGRGRRLTLTGVSGGLQKRVIVTVYDETPRMAFFEVQYTNKAGVPTHVTKWTNHAYSVAAKEGAGEPAFWSYQSGSYKNRPDWVLPLKVGFKQDNFLGMNSTDYGGEHRSRMCGAATWVSPSDTSSASPSSFRSRSQCRMPRTPHGSLVPNGHNAQTGRIHRNLSDVRGGAPRRLFPEPQGLQRGDAASRREVRPGARERIRRHLVRLGLRKSFTPAQVENALPVVKKLGFAWVGVDDGWQTNEGDWALLPAKFPNGDRDMRALVDKIHADKFNAQLWWAPLATKPDAEIAKAHPEMLLLNADGSKQKISYWNDWYFCPADKAVIEYHRQLVTKMFRDWGYDGLKLDGQHMNAVPPCYNPAHKHKRPEDSVEALPAFFKMIYDTARSIKPDALVEFCPCGTGFNFFTLPNLNMSVASDPHNSWQVRTKGKTLKALHGDAIAYFGDHVELSEAARFASTLGIGGVVGRNSRGRPVRRRAPGSISCLTRSGPGRSGSASTTPRCCRGANISVPCTTSASTSRRLTRSESQARCFTRFTPPNGTARFKSVAWETANTRLSITRTTKCWARSAAPPASSTRISRSTC